MLHKQQTRFSYLKQIFNLLFICVSTKRTLWNVYIYIYVKIGIDGSEPSIFFYFTLVIFLSLKSDFSFISVNWWMGINRQKSRFGDFPLPPPPPPQKKKKRKKRKRIKQTNKQTPTPPATTTTVSSQIYACNTAQQRQIQTDGSTETGITVTS